MTARKLKVGNIIILVVVISLMVNDKFRSAFEHQMGIDTGASVENRYWLDAALETLANSTNNDDYHDDTIKI